MSSSGSLKEFVETRVKVFSNNVDKLQGQAEMVARHLAEISIVESPSAELEEQGEDVDPLTSFMQARLNTFSRNMETLSSVFSNQN